MSKLTASEEVLMAAVRLSEKKNNEFNEWDLTIEAWIINKNKWGLKGHEKKYPDHKRVMNEIMARGDQKVIGKGWIKRIRPNYYSVTPLGFARAQSLSKKQITSAPRGVYEYESISPYVNSEVFKKYCKDPKEPRTWLGAAAFLKLEKYTSDSLEKKLKYIRDSIDAALDWLKKNKTDLILRSDSHSSKPISKNQLVKLKEFLSIIEERFETQLDAIRSKKK